MATRRQEVAAAGQRRRRAANPEKYRELGRKYERKRKLKKYGLTEEEYEKKFLAQGCACEICGSYEPGGKRDWHVDHDHATGNTRGLLCHHCNLMLGNARDDDWILLQGIAYLRKYS